MRSKVLESRGAILSLILRGVEIVWSLGFYWSTLMYDCFVGRDEEVVPFRARQLRNLLCDLGPSFIKAGQVCRILIHLLLSLSIFVGRDITVGVWNSTQNLKLLHCPSFSSMNLTVPLFSLVNLTLFVISF